MEPLSQWEFDIYALSLPRGHDFSDHPPVGIWRSADGLSCGVLTQDVNESSFGILLMRRRIDHVWAIIVEHHGFQSLTDACADMERQMRDGELPEPIPSGIAARPALYDPEERTASDVFSLLTRPSHHPAAWTLNQLYLALPRPDRNWASDCQTGNFHTRLWEAQLLASFREQGLLVTQPHESPDFRIENRRGGAAWVEAVTANPSVPYNHVNATFSAAPTDRMEIFFGSAALRYAKTLGNKLARGYERFPHVSGQPFMLAIADFQAPGSMIWSREGLIGYLYGEGAQEVETGGRKQAKTMYAKHLLGDTAFPAGLFADEQHAELSAVIFSNACSMAKTQSGRGLRPRSP